MGEACAGVDWWRGSQRWLWSSGWFIVVMMMMMMMLMMQMMISIHNMHFEISIGFSRQPLQGMCVGVGAGYRVRDSGVVEVDWRDV